MKTTSGDGLTVMKNCLDGPEQLTLLKLKFGVTVIVAVFGDAPELSAIKEMFPLPDDGSPILGLSLVHVYVVLPIVLEVVKLIVADWDLQNIWSFMPFT